MYGFFMVTFIHPPSIESAPLTSELVSRQLHYRGARARVLRVTAVIDSLLPKSKVAGSLVAKCANYHTRSILKENIFMNISPR